MHTDVVADPDAMMVEIVCTSVTSLAVFCVLKNVSVADVTEELILARVETKLGKALLFGCTCQSFKNHGRIGRVTPCHYCREYYHCQER